MSPFNPINRGRQGQHNIYLMHNLYIEFIRRYRWTQEMIFGPPVRNKECARRARAHTYTHTVTPPLIEQVYVVINKKITSLVLTTVTSLISTTHQFVVSMFFLVQFSEFRRCEISVSVWHPGRWQWVARWLLHSHPKGNHAFTHIPCLALNSKPLLHTHHFTTVTILATITKILLLPSHTPYYYRHYHCNYHYNHPPPHSRGQITLHCRLTYSPPATANACTGCRPSASRACPSGRAISLDDSFIGWYWRAWVPILGLPVDVINEKLDHKQLLDILDQNSWL